MKLIPLVAVFLCCVIVHHAESQVPYWIPTNGPVGSSDVRSLAVNSAGVVFAGTYADNIIWKTTNVGGTWTEAGAIPDPGPVLSISHNSRDHLFASVYEHGVYRSTDNGATWVKSDSGITGVTVRSNFVDKSGTVWVATEQGLFRSTDNGDSWSLARSGYFYNVFLDSSTAIVMEDGANLYRSTDQGTSWTSRSFTGLSLLGVHPDGSYIANTGTSQIFRSTDYGASWIDLHTGVSWGGAGWSATFSPRGDIFYARDGAGILASLDTGKTWNVMNSGLTTTSVLPLLYHPMGYVFVGTVGSGVFRTRYPVDSSIISPVIVVQPGALDFGEVKIGKSDTLSLQISNAGSHDSLRLGSIASTNERFRFRMDTLVIPALSARTATVVYTPTAFAVDTGAIRITTNDPGTPLYIISLLGRGYDVTHAPRILTITISPYNSSQARIVWTRSLDDSAGAPDQVTQYSIWRRDNGTGTSGQSTRPNTVAPIPLAGSDVVWDFITTVPAVGFDSYASVIPIPYTYSSPPPVYVFVVVAQTKSMQVYTSLPDSITGPGSLTGTTERDVYEIPRQLVLKQNYPNPFNPSTTITYGLPSRANVSLVVYNSLGQVITTLVNREEDAGYHEARFDGSNVASGVYFCRIRAGEFVRTSRLLLLR